MDSHQSNCFANSYFSSVDAAKLLHMSGFQFIGVANTATKKCKMAYLGAVELKKEEIGLVLL